MTTAPSPSAPSAAAATLREDPLASGTAMVTGTVDPVLWGKCRLVSVVKGRYNDSVIDITEKGTKKGAISKELLDRMEDVWKKAEEYCNKFKPGAHDGDIDFSALSISFKDNGGKTHTIDEYTITDPELAKLMREINYLAKELGQFTHSSQPGVRSNRPANAPAPLEKTSAAWIQDHTRGADDFLASKDYQYLAKTLNPPTLVGHAGDKIRAAESFISLFSNKLHAKKTVLKDALDRLSESELDKRIAKRKQIEQIEAQIAKLAQLDKKAIFWNVAHANDDFGATSMHPDVRLARAREIRSSMASNLTRNNTLTGNTLKDSRFSSRPDEAYLTAYAKDAGELFLHDRWLYEQHLALGDTLTPKHACAEELVVNVISSLNDPRFDLDEAVSSLALPAKGDIHDVVAEALGEARDQLRADLFGIPVPPPPTAPTT